MNAFLLRAQGCLMGLVCGNSLGYSAKSKTEEEIAKEFPEGLKEISGHSTNNIELAIALARAIIRGKGYDKNKALAAYLEWYSTSPAVCGKTIAQALSSGGKFKNHQSMASGALKRTPIIALAGFGDEPTAVVDNARQDASITHPNSMCLEADMLFTAALSFSLNKPGTLTADMVFNEINAWAYKLRVSDIIFKAVQAAKFDLPEDYVTKQGFVLIPLQNALWHLLHTENAEEALIQTVAKGGNTDTNAALCGALFGAVHGLNVFPERWRQAVLHPQGVAEARPERYLATDVLELADSLMNKKWTEGGEEKAEEDVAIYAPDAPQAVAAVDNKKAEELESKELELVAKARALTAKEATLTSLAESLEKREEELKKSLSPAPRNEEILRELNSLKEENDAIKAAKEALEKELDTIRNAPAPTLAAEGELAEREQALAEKERSVLVLEADVARREEILGRQGERIEAKESELVEKSTEINLKIQELKNERVELEALKDEKHASDRKDNADREEAFTLKEQSLNERLEALRERESALKDSEKSLREREQALKSAEAQSVNIAPNEEFAAKEGELAARETTLFSREDALVAKEEAFAAKETGFNEELAKREGELAARETALFSREDALVAKEEAFAAKETGFNEELAKREGELAARESAPASGGEVRVEGGGDRAEILREVATKLLAKNMLSKIITDVTGLPSEELDKLRGS